MKVRKQSPIIEAFHFTEESVKHPEDWPSWLLESCNTNYKHGCYFYETSDMLAEKMSNLIIKDTISTIKGKSNE